MMSSRRVCSMKGYMQTLCHLLIIHWALIDLPGLSHAASSSSKADYLYREGVAQEAFHLFVSNGRQLLQETPSPAPVLFPVVTPTPTLFPFLSPAPTPFSTPAPISYAPGPSRSSTPGPAPMPVLFPSDPPVTIPYSPAPGVLVIPPGNCSVDLAALEPTIFTTVTDCSAPLAVYVGVAMCCPQIDSLLRIVQGQHILATGDLGLNVSDATFCYSEIASIISGKGTNSSQLCSIHASNLTVGSCPVTTVQDLQLKVNTTSLLKACEGVDPLKECTSKACQNEIGNATMLLAGEMLGALADCQSVVLSWVASHSPAAQANSDLRLLTSCTVNQECPLVFNDTSSVAKACNSSTRNITCCEGLSLYMENDLQTQMLVTNQQAYTCAESFGLDLINQNVTTDIYTLCKIRLSDFSLQAHGTEGCLLSSYPTDINITTGVPYFICDLNDNIQARWPGLTTPSVPISPISSPLLPPSPSPEPSQPSMGTSLHNGYGLSTLVFTLIVVALTVTMS